MRAFALLAALSVTVAGCSKKEPKPLRTEPWLAHPPASARPSASTGGDAGPERPQCAFDQRSVAHVSLTADRGLELVGKAEHVTGFIGYDPSDLSHSNGFVRVDLRDLSFGPRDGSADPALGELAKQALDIAAGGANLGARFELTGLEDASPAALEPVPESSPLPFKRKLRATAVGTLLVHGFRVERRIPVLAECEYRDDRQIPAEVAIWTAKPFVISLDTHAIEAVDRSGKRAKAGSVRVSIELHCKKVDGSRSTVKPPGQLSVPVVP